MPAFDKSVYDFYSSFIQTVYIYLVPLSRYIELFVESHKLFYPRAFGATVGDNHS